MAVYRDKWNGYTGNNLYSQYKWANTLQAEIVDFRNCVIYNCGNGCYGGPGGGFINMVNNYYKTGPAGSTNRVSTVSSTRNAGSQPRRRRWLMKGNFWQK